MSHLRFFFFNDEAGDPGDIPDTSTAGDSWSTSEIGRYFLEDGHQFDGTILGTWKTEIAAAVSAGAPYPWMSPELKRRIFEYVLANP